MSLEKQLAITLEYLELKKQEVQEAIVEGDYDSALSAQVEVSKMQLEVQVLEDVINLD